jgi:hypothetical protein
VSLALFLAHMDILSRNRLGKSRHAGLKLQQHCSLQCIDSYKVFHMALKKALGHVKMTVFLNNIWIVSYLYKLDFYSRIVSQDK